MTKEDVELYKVWKSQKIAESSYGVIGRLFFCRFPLGNGDHRENTEDGVERELLHTWRDRSRWTQGVVAGTTLSF